MAAHMTGVAAEPWIPEDTFRNRLGIVRVALGGLNIKEAAELCSLNAENWRRWEDGLGSPRNLEAVCRQISDATGIDFRWLIAGGPLTIGSFSSELMSLPVVTGQGALLNPDLSVVDFYSRPFLSLV